MIENLKCPFNAPLIAEDFKCEHCEIVARRAGPDVACQSIEGHDRCIKLHEGLLQAVLDAKSMNYDLNEIPHSLLVKVQYGGLLGINNDIATDPDLDSAKIINIDGLVQDVFQHYSEEIPFEKFVESSLGYQLKRRGRKRP